MSIDRLLDRLVQFFTSLRLTVVCLVFGMVLVYAGTLAQTHVGLYRAQHEFFRSFFVFWQPQGAAWKIPVFPGGYLIGGLLLLNLIASTFSRVALTKRKAGIWLIHAGLILLLIGQLLTDVLSIESGLQFAEGETKNYSEDFRKTELVVVDTSDASKDVVYSIPERMLGNQAEVRDPRLPFAIRVKQHWGNASLYEQQGRGKVPEGAARSQATSGELKDILVSAEANSSDPDRRNTPAAVVEISGSDQSAGSFLVSPLTTLQQGFSVGGRKYEVALRFKRYYYPFSLTLLKATHEKYKGTDIPKNFASRVRLQHPANNEARETVIYMNNPLRYAGQTFYQYQMSAGDMAERAGAAASSTLQVVKNPGWLTPYLSTVLVSLGLVVQFSSHLFNFARRRRS